jgi:hypothetical protein
MLYQFKAPEDLDQWTAFSDSEVGGQSTAALQAAEEPPGTATLTGVFSTEVGEGAHERLRRSGYAGITTKPSQDGPLDLEDFDTLVFRQAGGLCGDSQLSV